MTGDKADQSFVMHAEVGVSADILLEALWHLVLGGCPHALNIMHLACARSQFRAFLIDHSLVIRHQRPRELQTRDKRYDPCISRYHVNHRCTSLLGC